MSSTCIKSRLWSFKVPTLVAGIAMLSCAAHLASGAACIDSSTVMFGAPWQPSFTVEEQESQYKQRGDISQLALYYSIITGCLQGVKATYGHVSSVTSTIGVDFESAADSSTLVEQQVQLSEGEAFNTVEYKIGSCIEYMNLITNTGKILAIGNAEAPESLQSSRPADGSYLGFFKGTIDPATTVTEESGRAVPLQQLQLVWVSSVCSGTHAAEQSVIPAAAGVDVTATANRLRTVATPTQQQQKQAAAKPKQLSKVKSGSEQQHMRGSQKAAGEAVSVKEAPVIDSLVSGPSSRAATVSAAASNLTFDRESSKDSNKLSSTSHTEHSSAMSADNSTAAADAAATAASSGAAGGSCGPIGCEEGICKTSSCALNGMGKEVPALMCFGTNIVPNLLKHKVTSDLCANLACKLTKPKCTSTGLLGIGGFCTGRVVAMGATAELHASAGSLIGYPCLEHRGVITEMVSKSGDYSAKGTYVSKAWKVCDCTPFISSPEGSHSVKIGQLVDVEIADKKNHNGVMDVHIKTPSIHMRLPDFSKLFVDQPALSETLPKLPELNIDVNSVLHHLQKPVTNMTAADVLAQWITAIDDGITVPQLQVNDAKINALKALIPGFSAPAIIVPNVSAPLLKVPVALELPSFRIPEHMFPSVALLLPNISKTSLPSMVISSKLPVALPRLLVANVTIASFQTEALKMLSKAHYVTALTSSSKVLGPEDAADQKFDYSYSLMDQISNVAGPLGNAVGQVLHQHPAMDSGVAGTYAITGLADLHLHKGQQHAATAAAAAARPSTNPAGADKTTATPAAAATALAAAPGSEQHTEPAVEEAA